VLLALDLGTTTGWAMALPDGGLLATLTAWCK